MDPNLFVKNVSYKHLLLKKLSCSVMCSVLSQLLILILLLFVINFTIFHPVEWFRLAFNTITSINTWLFLIPFGGVVFAQTVICAKDYVLKEVYCLTRFQKLFSVLSVRNFLIFVLHTITGGLIVWLYLSLAGGKYEKLYALCLKGQYCLVEGTFYMILGGIWSGVYYFLCVYLTRKHLLFPVINQSKFLQFKTTTIGLLRKSKLSALWCTLYYFLLYYIWGSQIKAYFCSTIGVYAMDKTDLWVYLYVYLFAVLYCFNMNLMAFFFDLYLTEPIEFSLVAYDNNTVTLQEAIKLSSFPVLQKLACLDLNLLSFWSMQRRQIFFTISQPGGHPYNWNNLVESVIILFKEYAELLNKSTDNILVPLQAKKEKEQLKEAEQYQCKSPQKYPNIRNMSMMILDPLNIVDVSYQKQQFGSTVAAVSLSQTAAENFQNIITKIKKKLGYNYLFDELPEVNIRKCLANGQIIMWTAEGISTLAISSIKEDRYGIVQKDLPAIITSLVELKQSIDKLNKVPGLCRRSAGFDDFYYKMKLGVAAAVRRSLINICLHFGDYIQDFSLKNDVLLQLRAYTVSKKF